MTAIANTERTGTGRLRAVCEYCGKRSRPVDVGERTRLGILDLPAGWSEAPYSPTHVHGDGSTGSLWCCPACARRRDAGERLAPTPERAAARRAGAGS